MLVTLYGASNFCEMNKTGMLQVKKARICLLWVGINDHLDLCMNGHRNTPLKTDQLKNPRPRS